MITLLSELHLFRGLNMKPNFSELARKHNCDYRTVKKYYEGYEGKPKKRNKPSRLDIYYNEIKDKRKRQSLHILIKIITLSQTTTYLG